MSALHSDLSKGGKISSAGRKLSALALVFTLAGFSVACAEESSTEDAPVDVVSSDITDSPDDYLDSPVTVSGELGELIGERAFTVSGGGFLNTGGELLVVSAGPLEEVVQGAEVGEFGPSDTSDFVQVEGVVRRFEDVAALEEEIGTGVDEQFFEEYAGEPILVADQVLLNPGSAEERGRSDEPAVRAGGPTIYDLTRAPDDDYGDEVSIDGEVEDTLDGEAFVISGPGVGSDKGVLIVGEDGTLPEVSEGEAIRATGEFREFDEAEFEQELNVTYNDDMYVPYGLQPSVIATEIEQLEQL